MKELNLLSKEKGCREHPINNLTRALRKMGKGEKIKVIFDINDVPLEILEAIAKIRNVKISILEKKGGIVTAIAEKL